MHEKDQVLKTVVMEKRKVEIMMLEQDVTKKDADEEGLVFQLDLAGECVESSKIFQLACMHEKDQLLKIVMMEEGEVEILMPKDNNIEV
jgi:hypothetical protein